MKSSVCFEITYLLSFQVRYVKTVTFASSQVNIFRHNRSEKQMIYGEILTLIFASNLNVCVVFICFWLFCRFSFKAPRLDCYKGLKLDKDHVDRRDGHTQHLDFFREDLYPEGHRRSPAFSDDHHPFMRYNHSSQEELHHRRPPPRYDTVGYDDRHTLSPLHHREEGRKGHREGSKGSNHWVRSPKSPLRIQREELSSTPRFHSDHQQREAKMGKRREEQGGGDWEKFRDLSPSKSSHPQNWESAWERGRRNSQSCDRERWREDSHQERSPPFRRQRRKLEDGDDQNG